MQQQSENEGARMAGSKAAAAQSPGSQEAQASRTDEAAKPKKKNIIQVFRPQNSKTGMVKPGSRPRPNGPARPAGAPQGAGRPAAGARPAQMPQGMVRPGAAAGPQGMVRPGTAAGPQGMVRPGTAAGPQGMVRPGAAAGPAGVPHGAVRPAGSVPGSVRPAAGVRPAGVPQGMVRPAAGARPAGAPQPGMHPAGTAGSTASAQGTVRPAAGMQPSGAPQSAVQPVNAPAPGKSPVTPSVEVQNQEKAAPAASTAVQASAQTASPAPETVKEAAKTPEVKTSAETSAPDTGKNIQPETNAEEVKETSGKAAAEETAGKTAAKETAEKAAEKETAEKSAVKEAAARNTGTESADKPAAAEHAADTEKKVSAAGKTEDSSRKEKTDGKETQSAERPEQKTSGAAREKKPAPRSEQGARSTQSRYSEQGSGRTQNTRYQDQQGRGQGRGSDSSQGRGFGSRSSETGAQRSGQRTQDGGQGRGFGPRTTDPNRTGAQGRTGGRFGDNAAGRPGMGKPQAGRPAGGPKAAAQDTKPLEKESRKRTERGDRNRDAKGEKLDRLEQTGRNAKKPQSAKPGPKTGTKGVKPAPKPVAKPEPKEEVIKNIVIPEKLTIRELGDKMKVQPSAIVKKLFLQGVMVTVNEEIDFDKAEEIALEFNCICEKEEKVDVLAELLKEDEEDDSVMVSRPPVVCVMGHVDHGKTSLLDAIRDTHVIDKEAGGITQHIGAYVVSIDGQKITFLDTPGHEAFTAMRMRGANATDIAILVVAADDGVMPQTIEAINHAKAAGVEIIVAINKIDKPSANVDRVKQELSEYELIPEDWGGKTVMVPVSAHSHEGIDTLLEMILLTAEVLELKANPKRKARGLVIEAQLDKGKGPVATVLVQKGTLHVGDPIAAGSCYGKVRAMMDDKGRRVKEAGPSVPVEILGFSDVPNAGEIALSMDSEKEARSFAETFISEGREKMLEETRARMSLDDLFSQIQAGNLKELNLIVKADVQGSVEAVKQSLLKLSNDEVIVKIIHSGVGAINESDVSLASASSAIIIGFNVRPDPMAKSTAEQEGVDIRLYRVIYDAINDVENAMKGMLDPVFEEKIIGHAEVRQTFKASGVGTIAGSYVLDGVFQRGCKIRLFRQDKLIYEGALASLKRFKDDVKEVKAGYECGLVFEKYNDILEEDRVEAYTMVEVPR